MNATDALLELNPPKKEYNTPYRYYMAGRDVTDHVMNQTTPPGGWMHRFFEIECK